MSEWNETSKCLPTENSNVLIMMDDASGGNAIYKEGFFILNNKKVNIENVVFWKYTKGVQTLDEQINKKCLMCGRKRLYG